MGNGNRLVVLVGFGLSIIAGTMGINSCVHAPRVMPESKRTNAPGICFERDILPIFVSNCAKSGCHDAGSHEEGYVLDNYQNIIKKGIVPGNVAASKIYESVMPGNDDDKMPKDAPPLTAVQLDKLKQWIAAGATDGGDCTTPCDTSNYTYSGVIAPMMTLYCVGCHSSASSPGGSLADYNSVMVATVTGRLIGNISHQAGYNPMPPGSSVQLSACEVTQVKKWLAAGALNN